MADELTEIMTALVEAAKPAPEDMVAFMVAAQRAIAYQAVPGGQTAQLAGQEARPGEVVPHAVTLCPASRRRLALPGQCGALCLDGDGIQHMCCRGVHLGGDHACSCGEVTWREVDAADGDGEVCECRLPATGGQCVIRGAHNRQTDPVRGEVVLHRDSSGAVWSTPREG